MKAIVVFVAVLCFPFFMAAQTDAWEDEMRVGLEKMADSLSVHLKPWKVPNRTFKVEDYGAVGDGKTLNTISIQKTIDVCSSRKGGVVLLAKGDYVTGTIVLKSGVMLEVAKGARILGSTSLVDYPEQKEKFRSIMSHYYEFSQSLIYAEKANKIGIRGKGEIYFRGERVNFPGPQTIGKIAGRPLGIRMIECSNVVLKDILLHNSAAWMQNYVFCNNLVFDGVKVVNHANYNNDGLDPDGCRNVIVRNCFINSEDDAMCLKGGSNRPSENILIENSTFVSTCNAFKIGTDTQGAFRNIVARNLVLGGIPDSLVSIAGNQASSGVTLATVDGGDVENVYLKNITINQARCPLFLRIGNRMRILPELSKPSVGHLRNILIENVDGERNFSQGSFISGIASQSIENVIVRNVDLKMAGGAHAGFATLGVVENEGGYPDAHQFSVFNLPAYGFYVRHAKNVWFDNIKVTPIMPDNRPAFIASTNVVNAMANGITIPLQQVVNYSYLPKCIDNVSVNADKANVSVLQAHFSSPIYSDRKEFMVEIDSVLLGAEFICWPNALKNVDKDSLLTFNISTKGKLYIAHSKGVVKPKWLELAFTNCGKKVLFGNWEYDLFEMDINKPSHIELGPNQQSGMAVDGCNNFIVFFQAKTKE